MKKLKLILAILLISAGAFAQNVGINSNGSAPDASAMLDVSSTSKGFLPPRIALTGSTDAATISSPVAGLLIYNTSNTNDVTPGYYYYSGSSWVKVDAGLWSFDLEEDISTNYNVGIGTSSPAAELDVNGVALSNFEGFSYYVTGLIVTKENWEDLVIPTEDYNTFSGTSYNTSAGTFTAPRTGYYRFTLTGYSTTHLTDAGDRYAIGVKVNDVLKSFAGGSFSVYDTPLTTYTQVIYLNSNDVVKPAMYTAIDATLGGVVAGHEFWFQGEFVGK